MNPHGRLSLPSERPYTGNLSALTQKRWRSLLGLFVLPLLGCIWRAADYGPWIVVPFCLGLAVTFACWHTLAARTTNANSYVYHRHERPVGYWCTWGLELLLYGVIVVGIWFAPVPSAPAPASAKGKPERISAP
jgi:hypothetical protein